MSRQWILDNLNTYIAVNNIEQMHSILKSIVVNKISISDRNYNINYIYTVHNIFISNILMFVLFRQNHDISLTILEFLKAKQSYISE